MISTSIHRVMVEYEDIDYPFDTHERIAVVFTRRKYHAEASQRRYFNVKNEFH